MGELTVNTLALMWEEQTSFNALFRGHPTSFSERSALTRDMVLHMIAECTELLETTDWKQHRKLDKHENRAHTKIELVDIFKFWLTVVLAWEITPEEFVDAFWEKSAVVRQRYAEEWMMNAECPLIVVDFDNTLCDYIQGICLWVARHVPRLASRAASLAIERAWVNAKALNIDEIEWQSIKHEFRVSGGKRELPPMDGAYAFSQQVEQAGYQLVILTSRPVDAYPNIYHDTLYWLNEHQISYAAIWWAADKAERLAMRPEILRRVRGFVDDDWRYASTVANLGIPTVWLNTDDRLCPHDMPAALKVRRTLGAAAEVLFQEVRRNGE